MKEVHDHFSHFSESYKKYRPSYPEELYLEILKFVKTKDSCWDCGTGNGQVAVELSKYFKKVFATDISQKQLDSAAMRKNIFYSKVRAEQSGFEENKFDLITAAQSVHWFDFDEFNREVLRVAKDGAVLALWGYGLIEVTDPINKLIRHFYKDTIGKYWNLERKHIDHAYETIPFNFKQLNGDSKFIINQNWNLKQLEGYLNTWSGVKNYMKDHDGKNPVLELIASLKSIWGEHEKKEIRFPVFLKAGRIEK